MAVRLGLKPPAVEAAVAGADKRVLRVCDEIAARDAHMARYAAEHLDHRRHYVGAEPPISGNLL